uniref:ubiquitinyl hydrolase 1 n=1 Tax=Ditylenchus dipsaci TaxID=166011 RepID=A0A915DYZ8_9BILA
MPSYTISSKPVFSPWKVIGMIDSYTQAMKPSTFHLYSLQSVRDEILVKIMSEMDLDQLSEALIHRFTPQFAKKESLAKSKRSMETNKRGRRVLRKWSIPFADQQKQQENQRCAVAKEFGKLVQQMWCGEHDSLAPQNFRSEITEIAPDFKGHHQHDTQEFTMFLLDGLHDDLNRANKDQSLPNREYGPEVPHKEVADATWRKYKSDNDSIVTDLFHGQLKSTTICKNCSAESVTFDPFCYLRLVFITNEPKEQEVSISECLRNFTEPEQIEKNCQCGSQCCEKTLNIWRLPEILVVHLKRYQFVGGAMTRIKTFIKFALKDFNLEDAIANSEEQHQLYELISATFHTGTLTDGHYTACVLKDAWRVISDRKVTNGPNVNLREASSDDVYVLYYRKMASPLSRHTGCDGRGSENDDKYDKIFESSGEDKPRNGSLKKVGPLLSIDVLYDVLKFLDKSSLVVHSTSAKILSLLILPIVKERAYALLHDQLKAGVPPWKVIGMIDSYTQAMKPSTFNLYSLQSVRDEILLKIMSEMDSDQLLQGHGHQFTPQFAKKAIAGKIKALLDRQGEA